ncbi:MAG TPA: heme o synthase, partial [Halococcus sp.]|nr:heme o synthase [Halococcus sp.]
MKGLPYSRPCSRCTGLLAATAMGVYLLLVIGATATVTDAAATCSTWPICSDGSTIPISSESWVVAGHRVVAFLVGLLVFFTGVVALRDRSSRRVLAALGVAVLLYPAQALLGVVIATTGPQTTLVTLAGVSLAAATVHLAAGLIIFGGVLAALTWTLEAKTGIPDDDPAVLPNGPVPIADPLDVSIQPTIPTWGDDPLRRMRLTVTAYVRLMKPRLMWLLCLVAVAAMALAGGPNLTSRVVMATLVGGVLAIGAAGTFNHVLERETDRRMQRTNDRPLAVDFVSVRNAVLFGLLLTGASLVLFASVNRLAAILGLTAILFYSVVYTVLLKPNTPHNTVIGGFAGVLPAFIGWAAVTGTVGFGAIALGLLIFMWTPAHFYNLALAYKEDYERGGFPMMPVVRGETTTRRHIVWYLAATLAVAAAMTALPALGWLYALTSVGVGAMFLWAVVRLHYQQTTDAAFRAFHTSNAYLGAVLV